MNAYSSPIGPAWQDAEGYWRICIRGKDGLWKVCYLHRLIYEQAHGPIPPNHDIHHLDEDKGNCSLSNLRCLHHSEHLSLHHLGVHASHLVLADGTVAKQCAICGDLFPLAELFSRKTPAGTTCYRSYCRPCYRAHYGWPNQRAPWRIHAEGEIGALRA